MGAAKKRKCKAAKAAAAAAAQGGAAEEGSREAERCTPEAPDAADAAQKAAQATEASKDGGGRPEDAYAASAVIFFTRGDDGKVAKVLVCVEERKVQASYIGLSEKGKVVQRMIVFPMGRRERKDKGDTVETAKREYIEETGDYGYLSRYLDVADFTGTAEPLPPPLFSGTGNMAVYFTPASMINLFCEVPTKCVSSQRRVASGGINLKEAAAAERKVVEEAAARKAAEAEEAAAEGPSKKKRKKEKAPTKTASTFTVGRTDHLEPFWLDAEELRLAVASGGRSPVIQVNGEECRLFPTAASVLRMAEVREWLGVPPKGAGEESAEPTAPQAAAEAEAA